VPSAPPTAAGYARFDLHGTHFGVKAYSKDPRLRGVDAVDRGMVCKGMVRREVAHTREALEEAILDALSSVKLEYVGDGFRTGPLRTTGSMLMKAALSWLLQLLSEVYMVRPS
jgi:hypothetical protein